MTSIGMILAEVCAAALLTLPAAYVGLLLLRILLGILGWMTPAGDWIRGPRGRWIPCYPLSEDALCTHAGALRLVGDEVDSGTRRRREAEREGSSVAQPGGREPLLRTLWLDGAGTAMHSEVLKREQRAHWDRWQERPWKDHRDGQ